MNTFKLSTENSYDLLLPLGHSCKLVHLETGTQLRLREVRITQTAKASQLTAENRIVLDGLDLYETCEGDKILEFQGLLINPVKYCVPLLKLEDGMSLVLLLSDARRKQFSYYLDVITTGSCAFWWKHSFYNDHQVSEQVQYLLSGDSFKEEVDNLGLHEESSLNLNENTAAILSEIEAAEMFGADLTGLAGGVQIEKTNFGIYLDKYNNLVYWVQNVELNKQNIFYIDLHGIKNIGFGRVTREPFYYQLATIIDGWDNKPVDQLHHLPIYSVLTVQSRESLKNSETYKQLLESAPERRGAKEPFRFWSLFSKKEGEIDTSKETTFCMWSMLYNPGAITAGELIKLYRLGIEGVILYKDDLTFGIAAVRKATETVTLKGTLSERSGLFGPKKAEQISIYFPEIVVNEILGDEQGLSEIYKKASQKLDTIEKEQN